jgi:hypothetical protein
MVEQQLLEQEVSHHIREEEGEFLPAQGRPAT